MKHTLIFCALCATVVQAHAGIIFTPGNDPQQPNEENVLFNSDQSASTVMGVTNQTGTTVYFSSTMDTLVTTANGQAQVTAADGAVNDITISLAPGQTYQDLILNPFLGSVAAGPATVTVVATDGTFTYDYPSGLGNGNNFLTITTSGDSIISTTIDASTGFDVLKQPRISGVSSASVPEPASALMLAGGILALCLIRLERRANS